MPMAGQFNVVVIDDGLSWSHETLDKALRSALHHLRYTGKTCKVEYVNDKAQRIDTVACFHAMGIIAGGGRWANYVTEKTWERGAA